MIVLAPSLVSIVSAKFESSKSFHKQLGQCLQADANDEHSKGFLALLIELSPTQEFLITK